MAYRALADLVVVLHFLFIAVAVGGGLVLLRWPRLVWVHLPIVAWAALIEFFSWMCPLTPLENWLRVRGGAAGYTTSFTEHYIFPIIYPAQLTYGVQLALGLIVVTINAVVYVLVFRRRSA